MVTSNIVSLRRPDQKTRSPSKSLTAARIKALEPTGSRYWEADIACPGLYVRVQPSGDKSFYVRGRIGSGRGARQRNIRLGSVEQIGLADARTRAFDLVAKMRAGADPTDRPKPAPTISELIDKYGSDLEQRGVVNARHVVSSLRRGLREVSEQKADALSRSDFIRAIDRVRDRSGPSASDAFRSFAAAMLNWGVNSGALRSSVLAGYKVPRRTKAQRLTSGASFTLAGTDMIRAFWQATAAAPDPVFRDYLRFLLLTGQRRSETAEMRWADISEDRWAIRAEVAKSGRAHVVPLGVLSRHLLDAQARVCGLVWPGRRGVPMAGWSKRLRPVKAAMREPRLAMHALRRGYRTGIRELGADTDLCEIMIGHARRGLVARYDKSEMWAARVELQRRWEDNVGTILQR